MLAGAAQPPFRPKFCENHFACLYYNGRCDEGYAAGFEQFASDDVLNRLPSGYLLRYEHKKRVCDR